MIWNYVDISITSTPVCVPGKLQRELKVIPPYLNNEIQVSIPVKQILQPVVFAPSSSLPFVNDPAKN